MADSNDSKGKTIGTAAAAAAALPVLDSIVNGLFQSYTNKQRMNFDKEEARKQRVFSEMMWQKQADWDLDMWNKSNEYNSASAQVDRLREAGLNPLYYGIDGVAAQPMSAPQALGYDRASAANITNPYNGGLMNVMSSMKDVELKDAQIAKLKSETKAIDYKLPFEVDELRNRVRKSGLDADAQETINKYIDRQQEAEIRLKNANADEADAMVQKAAAEIDKMDYEKTTMFMSWLETRERILTLQKQRELTDKQMEELSSLIRVNNANADKIGLDVSNYDDITVIGTASRSMRFGPISVQEGDPLTLAMKKAAEEHLRELKEEKAKEKKKEGFTANSPYDGPIYD